MKCHRNGAHFNFFLQENQLLSLILQAVHGGTASLCSKYLTYFFLRFLSASLRPIRIIPASSSSAAPSVIIGVSSISTPV